MTDDKLDFLRNVSLFMQLSSSEIGLIQSILVEEKYDADTVVIAEGIPGEALYILYDGSVVVEKIFYDEKVKIATLKSGAIIGEMSLVDNYPTSATVTTTSATTFFVLYKDKLNLILENNFVVSSKFWHALSRILCNRIRAANEGLREYFIINQALVANSQFRELYALSHGAQIKK